MRDVSFLQEQWARLHPPLASGAIDPLLGNSYPLAEATAALLEIDERRALAKVLLTLR